MILAAQVDVAQIITAAGGFVSAAGWAFTQYRTHATAKETLMSVGPANGTSVTELVTQVAVLDTYTHASVHALDGNVKALMGFLGIPVDVDGTGPTTTPPAVAVVDAAAVAVHNARHLAAMEAHAAKSRP